MDAGHAAQRLPTSLQARLVGDWFVPLVLLGRIANASREPFPHSKFATNIGMYSWQDLSENHGVFRTVDIHSQKSYNLYGCGDRSSTGLEEVR